MYFIVLLVGTRMIIKKFLKILRRKEWIFHRVKVSSGEDREGGSFMGGFKPQIETTCGKNMVMKYKNCLRYIDTSISLYIVTKCTKVWNTFNTILVKVKTGTTLLSLVQMKGWKYWSFGCLVDFVTRFHHVLSLGTSFLHFTSREILTDRITDPLKGLKVVSSLLGLSRVVSLTPQS